MISFGPLTGNNYGPIGGPGSQITVFDTGQSGAPILSVSLTAAASVVGYTGSAWGVEVHWYDASDVELFPTTDTGTLHYNTDPTASLSGGAPTGTTRATVVTNSALNVPDTGSITVNGSLVQGGVCQYGTEKQPGAGIFVAVTSALVDAAIVALGGGILAATAFDTMIGLPVLLDNTCDVPPTVPTFDASDFIPGTQIWSPGSLAKRWQALAAGIWMLYCRCKLAPIGSPAPTQPTQPKFPPTSLPALGTPSLPIVCDPTELCTTLNLVVRELASLNSQVALGRADIQLIQRQAVPFAYVPGTLHTGLSGAGTITLSSPLGLIVQSTALPGYLSSDMAPVASYFKIGEISLGTVDGWTARRIVTHNPHLYVDVDADMTRLGYLFEAGVTANVQELVREP
jgi:hypothetical protein